MPLVRSIIKITPLIGMQKTYQDSGHIKQLASRYQSTPAQELLAEYDKQKSDQDLDKCVAIIHLLKKRNIPLPQDYQRVLKLYDKALTKVEGMHESVQGWKIERYGKKKECTISTKVISAGRVLVRFEGQLEINFFNLASMIYEVDLFHEWMPFCKEAQTIKTVSTAAKIAKIAFDLPFLSRRQGYLFGQGIDRIQHANSVMLFTEGITGDEEQQKRHAVSLQMQQGSVILGVKFFVCEITIMREGIYMFRAYADIDLGVSFLPGFVLGFLTKKIGHWIFDKMLQIANDIEGTAYQKRIEEDNEGFYRWLGERMSKFKNRTRECEIEQVQGMIAQCL